MWVGLLSRLVSSLAELAAVFVCSSLGPAIQDAMAMTSFLNEVWISLTYLCLSTSITFVSQKGLSTICPSSHLLAGHGPN